MARKKMTNMKTKKVTTPVLLTGVSLDEISVDHEKNSRVFDDERGYDRAGKSRDDLDLETHNQIDDLVASIRDVGQLSPLVVRAIDGTDAENGPWELIAGYRRYMALEKLGTTASVLAFPAGMDDSEILAINLIENLEREDLNVAEKADGLFRYQELTGAKNEVVADKFGMSKSHASLLLRIRREAPAAVWAQWSKNPSILGLHDMRKIMEFATEEERIQQFEIAIGKAPKKSAKNPEDPDGDGDGDGKDAKKKVKRQTPASLAMMRVRLEFLASAKGQKERGKFTLQEIKAMLALIRWTCDQTQPAPVEIVPAEVAAEA